MGWEDIIRRVLPSTEGFSPHTTSAYGARRTKGTNPHRGVDFNYNVGPNGQTGINRRNPVLHSPIAGVVTNAGEGSVGRIAIRDANGFSHEPAHCWKIAVHLRYGCAGRAVRSAKRSVFLCPAARNLQRTADASVGDAAAARMAVQQIQPVGSPRKSGSDGIARWPAQAFPQRLALASKLRRLRSIAGPCHRPAFRISSAEGTQASRSHRLA